MIDPRILRDQPDRVRAAQAKRGLSDAVVDEALAADSARRTAISVFETLRAEQKSLGKQVAQAQGEEKQELLARTKALAAEVKAAEAAQNAAEEAWQAALLSIPNLAAEETPAPVEETPAATEATETSAEEPTEEPTAEAEPEPAPAPAAPAAPASSGAAHTPRTDVDIHGAGSLFDL